MTKFFKDILLEGNAIYTLWGSKPITQITLYHYTQEEEEAYYHSLTEEEKKRGRLIEDYDLPENWEKWKKIRDQFPMKRYLLFESHLIQTPKASFIFFVDILKTAIVIQEHYEIFRRATGFDFNPLEAVLEMPNEHSEFWGKVKGNAYLWGLLFGFGKKNSFAFHWKYYESSELCQKFFDELPSKSSNEPLRGKVEITFKKLRIPSFMSFDDNDEMIERYKTEREQIQKTYQGKDFLELTLQKLTR